VLCRKHVSSLDTGPAILRLARVDYSRFLLGLSHLILQYILYSKNEGKITPRFLLWENHTFKARGFACQHQKISRFRSKIEKKIPSANRNAAIQKETAVYRLRLSLLYVSSFTMNQSDFWKMLPARKLRNRFCSEKK
jgi:hypothetical protein